MSTAQREYVGAVTDRTFTAVMANLGRAPNDAEIRHLTAILTDVLVAILCERPNATVH